MDNIRKPHMLVNTGKHIPKLTPEQYRDLLAQSVTNAALARLLEKPPRQWRARRLWERQLPKAFHIPEIQAERVGDSYVVRKCPLCGRKHTHGAAGDPEGPTRTHRVAHCQPPWPGGYWLLVDGWTLEKSRFHPSFHHMLRAA